MEEPAGIIEALWNYYKITYPWWDFMDKNVNTGWVKDWDENDFAGSAIPWLAFGRDANWNSTMHDEPSVGWKANSVFFWALSKVKCIRGHDAGQIYATFPWGYYDYEDNGYFFSKGGWGSDWNY
jgi:hypothetical protein